MLVRRQKKRTCAKTFAAYCCASQRVRQLQCYVVNNAAVHAGIYVSYLLVMSGTACLMIKEHFFKCVAVNIISRFLYF